MRRLVSATVAGVLAVGATPALADRGVAIDLGRIEIEQALTPGGSYQLPTIGVRNPGTETTSYRLAASPVESDDAEPPPESWFEFEPAELTLEAGETRAVRARIALPSGADPGDYIALVGAQIVTKSGGAQVGAAAAARTTFTVEPATTLDAWWLKVKTVFSEHGPWSWFLPALAGSLLALWWLARRFSFRVERRPA